MIQFLVFKCKFTVIYQPDMVVDGLVDIQNRFYGSFRHLPENEQNEAKQKFARENLPNWIKYYEGFLDANGDYYTGEFSWADIAVYNRLSELLRLFPEAFSAANKVKNHLDRIANRPRIAARIQERPQTQF